MTAVDDRTGNRSQIHPVQVQNIRLRHQPVHGLSTSMLLLLCPVYETVYRSHGAVGTICRYQNKRGNFTDKRDNEEKKGPRLDKRRMRSVPTARGAIRADQTMPEDLN